MSRLMFLIDVDNTLIDNDRVKSDLQGQIQHLVGSDRRARFWAFYEQVRREQDYVDFPRTLERFRAAFPAGCWSVAAGPGPRFQPKPLAA